jgi:hypothetical protein
MNNSDINRILKFIKNVDTPTPGIIGIDIVNEIFKHNKYKERYKREIRR